MAEPVKTSRERAGAAAGVHPDTVCGCCLAIDDPNGPGPAINTGFCQECNDAGCPDALVGDSCRVVTP